MADPRAVPPAGEDIHLPGGSLQPLLLTVGITIALIGVTTSIVLLVIGSVVTIWVLIAWVRDAVAEFRHLPEDHAAGH